MFLVREALVLQEEMRSPSTTSMPTEVQEEEEALGV